MVAFNRRYAEVYATAHARTAGNVQFCVAQKNRRGSEYRATLENAIHMVDLLRWVLRRAGERYGPVGGTGSVPGGWHRGPGPISVGCRRPADGGPVGLGNGTNVWTCTGATRACG